MLMHLRKCLFSRNPLEYNFKRILFSRFTNDSKDNKFSEKISASENATTNTEASLDSSVLGKVLNMFDMVEKRTSETITPVTTDLPIKTKTSFAKLLRNSSLIQIGDPNGRLVVGTVIEALDDNLFIDFGGKFHCVCKKPRTKPELYQCGTKVRLRLIDLELASKFLGSDRAITLLEADATLLGLYKEQRKRIFKQTKEQKTVN